MPVPVSCIPKDFEPNGYVPLDHGAVSLLAPSRRYLAIAGKLNLAEAEINRLLAVVKPCKKVDQ